MRNCFIVEALILTKALLMLKMCELGRHYGSCFNNMWVPDKVMLCTVRKSEKEKNIRYVTCAFHIGGNNVKMSKAEIQVN